MGPRPSTKHTIERKDNNLGYNPDNCCWATRSEQANNKRTNHRLELHGESMTVTQWAAKVGITAGGIMHRLRSGWTVERTLTEPPKQSAGLTTAENWK